MSAGIGSDRNCGRSGNLFTINICKEIVNVKESVKISSMKNKWIEICIIYIIQVKLFLEEA